MSELEARKRLLVAEAETHREKLRLELADFGNNLHDLRERVRGAGLTLGRSGFVVS